MGWHVTYGLAHFIVRVRGRGISCKEHLDPCAALQRPAALREVRSSLKDKLGVGSSVAES